LSYLKAADELLQGLRSSLEVCEQSAKAPKFAVGGSASPHVLQKP
jgi:hypothetical protein